MKRDATSCLQHPDGVRRTALAAAVALAGAFPAVASADAALVFKDVSPPPLLIDPMEPDEDDSPRSVSAVESGFARRADARGTDSPLRMEFTQRLVGAKAGALEGDFQQARVIADVPGGVFKVRGRFASRDPLADDFDDPRRPDFEDSERNRLYDLRVEGGGAALGYGMRTYAAGDRFEALPGDKDRKLSRGRAGTEIWTSAGTGPFTVKPTFRQTYDNLERDRRRPRTVNNEAGFTVGHVLHDWPTVGYTVSYFSGDRSSAYEPVGSRSQSAALSSYEGSVYVAGESFDAYAYAQRQAVTDDDAAGSGDSVINYYYLGLGYRPTYTTGLNAFIGVSDEDYTGYGARSLGRDVYLDAYYVPSPRLSYSAYAGYGAYENAEWYLDYDYGYAGVDAKWVLDRRGTEATSLAVGLLYDQYRDRYYPDSNESDLTLWLRLRHEFDTGGGQPRSAVIPSP
jgi:hypothetical protein